MVGMGLIDADGKPVITEGMLNGVVVMILFSCIFSSILTQYSAQRIVLRDSEVADEHDLPEDDEKILVPIRYPEYSKRLVDLAMLMRNTKLHRRLVDQRRL